LLPKKTRDGKKDFSEKPSNLKITQKNNGIQLETSKMLTHLSLNNNGVKPTLMKCQLPLELSPTKLLKQVNLHHGINHLPISNESMKARLTHQLH
jgi:hypothetical protein